MKLHAVIDTNVLMSGIFFGGIPGNILHFWYQGKFELVLSEAIYAEYKRVHEELMVQYPGLDVAAILYGIIDKAKLIKPSQLLEQVCTDKDDDIFVACALSSKSIIVSGDKALLAVQGYHGLRVVTPRQFITNFL